MIVRQIDVEECVMPKEDPTWRFALAANPLSEGWIVRLTTDEGLVGHGYASSVAHLGAAHAGLEGTLRTLADVVIGQNPLDVVPIHASMDHRLRGNNMAKAGIDGALYDLSAQIMGVPLYRVLGGLSRQEIPLLRILAIKTPAEMATGAQRLIDSGYQYLKIKVHGDVREDVARVAAIRKQVGPTIHLTIDANQSYTPKAAIQAIGRMAELGIDLVEQPVNADDMRGLELVTHATSVAIEADESAESVDAVFTLVTNRIVDRVSLKVPKLGGIWRTMQAAAICDAARIPYRLGAAVGSRLLAAGMLHLAASLPGVDYACELAEYERLLDDPFEGLPVEGGVLRVPHEIGLGVHRRVPLRAT